MKNTRIARLKQSKRVRKVSKVVAIGLLVCPLTLGAINALADTEPTEPATEEVAPVEETETVASETIESTEPVETVELTPPVVEQTQETVVEYVEPESIAPEVSQPQAEPTSVSEVPQGDITAARAEYDALGVRVENAINAGADTSNLNLAGVKNDYMLAEANYFLTNTGWEDVIAALNAYEAEVVKLESTISTSGSMQDFGIDTSALESAISQADYAVANSSLYTPESFADFNTGDGILTATQIIQASKDNLAKTDWLNADIAQHNADVSLGMLNYILDKLVLATDEQDPAKDAQIEALREKIDILLAEIEPLAIGTDYQQRYEDLELDRIVVVTSKANFVDWYGWNYWYNYAIPELERIVNELTKLKADIPIEQVIYRVKYVYEDGMAIPGGYPDWDIRHANAGEEITEVAPEIGNHTLVSEPTQTKIIASDGSTVFTFVYRYTPTSETGKAEWDNIMDKVDDLLTSLEDKVKNTEFQSRYGDLLEDWDLLSQLERLFPPEQGEQSPEFYENYLPQLKQLLANLEQLEKDVNGTQLETPTTTKLESSIQEAEAKLTESGYTAESIKALEQALQNAKDVLANANSTQAEIDEAQTALDLAIANLVKEDNSNGTGNSTNAPNTSNSGTNNTNNQTNSNQNSNTTTTKPADNNTSKDGLPQTGEQSTTNTVIAGLSLAMLSILAWFKRKKV